MKRLKLEDDGHCFVCGRSNCLGLKLDFRQEDGRTVAEFTPGKTHQGFRDIVHGGIIAAVLDEAVVKAVFARGIEAVTAEITVRFRNTLSVGERVRIEADITKSEGRLLEASASLVRDDGAVAAEARAKLLRNG